MSRLAPDIREEQILYAALNLAVEVGYSKITREGIAARASISPALVSVRLGTMDSLRRKLMRYAIRMRCLKVIAQGLAVGDRHALKAPTPLKLEALAALA